LACTGIQKALKLVKGNVATKRPNVSYHNILIGISIGQIPTRTTNFDETLKYASADNYDDSYGMSKKNNGNYNQVPSFDNERYTFVMYIGYNYICKGKGKAVPLEAWSGPEGSRKLRFPYFVTMT
jgi:hypothetical protein